MADLEWEDRPERPMLRRAIRHRLRSFDPTMRVFAEEYLAESSPIDLLAVGGEGELVALRIGRGGDDATLLTRCLSDIAWLRPRIADFLKLAPTLGLETSAEPRAILVCPAFAHETLSAAADFPVRTVELMTYHGLRERGQLRVLLDSVGSPRATRTTTTPPIDPEWPPAQQPIASDTRASQPPTPARESETLGGFRTGLTDSDLVLEPLEEEKPFD